MLAFAEDLWNSVFTPGTTPTLILATHTTFALLIVSLTVFIFISNYNIHLINLLVIALLLWGTLTWFIREIEKSKKELKTNDELNKQTEQGTEGDGDRSSKQTRTEKITSIAKSTKPTQRKSRKV